MKLASSALTAGLTAATLVYVLTPFVRRLALRRGAIAKPVEDRWGRRVVTRFGGVAMYLGVLVSSVMWVPLDRQVGGLLVGSFVVFLVGLIDDLHRLRPYSKLLLQLAVGCLVVMSGIRIELIRWLWLAIPLSVLWFILVMNAFNLLDNMDGLAAGIGAIAAAFCAVEALVFHQSSVAVQAAIVVGACLGFLWYNFPPAKIYMGDSGSHLLGLSLAALALMGSWKHSTQLLSILAIPMLVLAVPIFDTCFVTLQRLLHRRHPFQGGTDHLSHRLVILGLSQRQTVLMFYSVGTVFGLLSLASLRLKPLEAVVMWLFALTALVLLGAFLARVNVYEVRRQAMDDASREAARSVTLIETMLMHKRRLLEVLVDFCLICGAYAGAHLLRFEGQLDPSTQALFMQSLPIVIIIKLFCFTGFGLYRGVWKYVGLRDLIEIFKAVTLGSVCSATAFLYLWRFQGFSRAVFIIDWLLVFLTVSASRVAERLLMEWIALSTEGRAPVLIIGAGDTGERVLRYLRSAGTAKQRVVGFLDDDLRKHWNRIHGVPVLGTRARLPRALEEHAIGQVLIAITVPPEDLLDYVQQCCESRGVAWKVVTAGMMDAV